MAGVERTVLGRFQAGSKRIWRLLMLFPNVLGLSEKTRQAGKQEGGQHTGRQAGKQAGMPTNRLEGKQAGEQAGKEEKS
jgi:hypothetical protein